MSALRRQVAVAVILPAAEARGPGAARLLETLAGNRRFRLAALVEAGPVANALPRMLDAYLAFEARFVAREKDIATPIFDRISKALPVLSLAEAAKRLEVVDVVVDLVHAEGSEELSARSRHGLWRLSATEPDAAVGDAMGRSAESPVQLTRLARPDGTWLPLVETAYDTKFLASRNLGFQREKAVQLVERELSRIAVTGAHAVPGPEAAPQATPRAMGLPAYFTTTGAEVARRMGDHLRARFGGRPGRFCLRLAPGTPLDFDLAAATELDAPRGHYWADPFFFAHDGETYLFFEDYDYQTGRGHIAVGRVKGDRFSFIGPALTAPHHLSYPFVFRHGDDVFMIPETNETMRLELWRATDFPTGWTLHATALEGHACADTILHEEDGQWWIFTNICRDSFGDFGSELHLFRTDGPEMTTVEPHPLNPVVIGSRTARGAGRLFRQDGKLYRPSQDNSHGTYGYGLNIMEVDVLSPMEYREHQVRHLSPKDAPGLIGCHHVDLHDGWVVCDVRKA